MVMTLKSVVHLIAGARPNFMKIAPLYHALVQTPWCKPVIVHTGQHYDINMSDAFFKDLKLPKPHVHLGIGSGTHAAQTGRIMIAYEEVLMQQPADLVVVVGDVNSTLAATLTAVKLGIKVAHLEAGLRSFDRTMPEEINRLVTDAIADLLWTPSRDGDENLLREGVAKEKIECVGNIMIDSLEMLRHRIEAETYVQEMGLKAKDYGLVTLHRPVNVDKSENLARLAEMIVSISHTVRLIFPIHPRTRKNLKDMGLLKQLEEGKNILVVPSLNYIRFMNLMFNACLVITDSGGIQEETTYLGISCLTLRKNTERPITISEGTNCLVDVEDLEASVTRALQKTNQSPKRPSLWDGKTAARVVRSIKRHLDTS
jgi:UDP-N-acetylglucosamine 2-epimerase (non-hydrolysing)